MSKLSMQNGCDGLIFHFVVFTLHLILGSSVYTQSDLHITCVQMVEYKQGTKFSFELSFKILMQWLSWRPNLYEGVTEPQCRTDYKLNS
ncbi:hypothetical protein C8R41DRAFT_860836 [Lentinula lateritia]|uniref:Uncharacterized protein n=1 Tax=Lentinula lateritia TaxID=40482 RepID=A0ABQ8UY71_9AGAR|nr:hypothetical protein C8R41DRAFT_860836 [Lentinula lateritia]